MERRCFPCRQGSDYGEGWKLIDGIVGGRVSVGLDTVLETEERRIEGLLRSVKASRDGSVYVGAPGVAVYFCRIGDCATARALLAGSSSSGGGAVLDCSLMCGATGADVVGALAAEDDGAFVARSRALLGRVPIAASSQLDADEWLYGRAGFLRALLDVRREAVRRGIDASDLDAAAKDVARALVASGAGRRRDVLAYEWCGDAYVGAAHGTAGILYVLMVSARVFADDGGFRSAILPPVRRTLDDVVAPLETRESNYPAVAGESRAHLVHVCHGAPGLVFALAEAASTFDDATYASAAVRAAETTWTFGLLTKGPGLCHGIAGNGYALLCAFRLTRDDRWLHRAAVFGAACCDEDIARRSRTPDNPLSLFEGLAGTACFLRDLREDPLTAELPLFEFTSST